MLAATSISAHKRLDSSDAAQGKSHDDVQRCLCYTPLLMLNDPDHRVAEVTITSKLLLRVNGC